MKKLYFFVSRSVLFLTAIVFILLMYACGGGETSDAGTNSYPTVIPTGHAEVVEAPAIEEAPAEPNENKPADTGNNNNNNNNNSQGTGNPNTQNPNNVDVRGSKQDSSNPCTDGGLPCGQGDHGEGNPVNGSENPNCRAGEGEVNPNCDAQALAAAALTQMAEFTPAPENTLSSPSGEITATPENKPNSSLTDIFSGDGFVKTPSYIPEQRRLTLEYPPRMKAKVESELVMLTLEVDDQANIIPTAAFQNDSVKSNVVDVPDLYDTHFVTAEAEFDMAGMTIDPPGIIFEPLLPGQSVTFTWSILPPETGQYKGKVWLRLNFVDKVNGDKSRETISGQVIEIEAVDFFGLSANFTRTSGVVGSVIGTVLGIPFFDDIVKFLFKRRRKTKL